MTNSTVKAASELVELRRRQYAHVADSLDAALSLESIVQEQAVTHDFRTVAEFFRTAPNEEARAHWAAWLDRATSPVPTESETR